MRTILRSPDFRLLFFGLVASRVAESIMLLALAIWVKDLTGSDGMAGATIFAMVVPMPLAPVVGWVVDRFRRRPFLVGTNLATAVSLTPLFAVHGRADVWLIYTVGALYGLSYLARGAALNGLLKDLVEEEQLASANGALQTVRQGLRLIGPLAGAALYAAMGGWTLAVVGMVGFVAAAAAVAGLRVRECGPATSEAPWTTEMIAGVRHLIGEPALRRAVLGMGAAVLVTGFLESLVFAYVDAGLGRTPAFVGVLVTVQGIGGLLGGLLSVYLVRRLGEIGALACGIGLFTPAALALAYPGIWLGFVAMVLTGCSLPLAFVGMHTLVQRRTSGPLLGRVAAATEASVSGPQAFSIGTGAVLVNLVDYRLLFVLVGAVTLLAAGYLWRGRRLSRPTPLAPVPISPAPGSPAPAPAITGPPATVALPPATVALPTASPGLAVPPPSAGSVVPLSPRQAPPDAA